MTGRSTTAAEGVAGLDLAVKVGQDLILSRQVENVENLSYELNAVRFSG